jgi:hypothetical protein
MKETTPEQRAKLAELVGINKKTHSHIFTLIEKDYDECPECGGDVSYNDFIECEECEWTSAEDVFTASLKFDAPCPLTGGLAADRVWLADVVAWLAQEDFQPRIHGGTVWIEGACEGPRKWQSVEDKCSTAALLLAAQAAGVPEIVAILGDSTHGN